MSRPPQTLPEALKVIDALWDRIINLQTQLDTVVDNSNWIPQVLSDPTDITDGLEAAARFFDHERSPGAVFRFPISRPMDPVSRSRRSELEFRDHDRHIIAPRFAVAMRDILNPPKRRQSNYAPVFKAGLIP